MRPATPAERRLRAQAAAHQSWANTADRSARTAAARKALDARFEREVDPEGTLPAAERELRAKAARSAYYAEIARKSLQARRIRKRLAEGK
jgi:hypothetical protein